MISLPPELEDSPRRGLGMEGRVADMKILVMGLDCAAPELLLGEEGLENLRRLMDAGCYGRLESIIPPITVPAWMCMATSQDPGSLGVYGFRNRVDHSYDGLGIVNSRSINAPADLGPGRTRGEALDRRRRPPVLSPPQGQRRLGRLLPDPRHRARHLHPSGRARRARSSGWSAPIRSTSRTSGPTTRPGSRTRSTP